MYSFSRLLPQPLTLSLINLRELTLKVEYIVLLADTIFGVFATFSNPRPGVFWVALIFNVRFYFSQFQASLVISMNSLDM